MDTTIDQVIRCTELERRTNRYRAFLREHDSLPTLDDLASLWGVAYTAACTYARQHPGLFSTRRKLRTLESYERPYRERLAIYNTMRPMLNRPPTRRELAEAWGIELPALSSYLGYLTRRGRTLPTSTFTAPLLGHVTRTLPGVVAQIIDRHRIAPAVTELALLYGVSKQRIDQIRDKLAKDGTPIQLRNGKQTIVWDVEVPE